MQITTADLGFTTPVLTLNTNAHAPWERTGTVQDVADIARAADRLGYAYLTCSEHVGIPTDVEPIRGGRYYDPLATFGYLAAVTQKIRFATFVLVLGYHHPLSIAKRYGTLDVMANGRVILGVGVGSLLPEFELLGLGGEPFETRGARGDDALRALRASLGKRQPEYDGSFYQFRDFIIDPCAIQQDMPLWIGGRSMRSLKRAVELADGWAPFGLNVQQLGSMIANAKALASWEAREKPLECILQHDGLLDPVKEPEQAAEAIRSAVAAGATKANLRFKHSSPAHFIEQLEATAVLKI